MDQSITLKIFSFQVFLNYIMSFIHSTVIQQIFIVYPEWAILYFQQWEFSSKKDGQNSYPHEVYI